MAAPDAGGAEVDRTGTLRVTFARSCSRRARRPLRHLALAVGPLPVVLLHAAGRPLLAGLVVAGLLLLVGSDRTWRSRAGRHIADRERTARLEHLEAVLELIYDDWISMESARGHADLERWRRTQRI